MNARSSLAMIGIGCLMLAARFAPAQETLPAPSRNERSSNERLSIVEFRGLPLTEALRILSLQTGMNIAPSTQAASKSISVFLRNVSPRAALETLTKTHGLFFREDAQSGIITVYTNEELQNNLQSFREQQIKVFTLLYPNAIDAARAVSDIFGNRVVMSYGEQGNTVMQDLSQRFSRFDMIDQRSQGLGIFSGGQNGTGGGGGGGLGGGGGGFGGGGLGGGGLGTSTGGFGGAGQITGALRSDLQQNNTVQRNAFQNNFGQQPGTAPPNLQGMTPEQIQAFVNAQQGTATAEQLQEMIRREQAQIFVTVIQRQNQLVVRTSDAETMKQICDLVTRLDVPTPLVLLEVKVLEVALSDDFNSVFEYQFSDNNLTAGQFTTGNILPPASDGLPGAIRRSSSLAPGGTGVINGTNGEVGAGLFQVVSEGFRFRMQMLESKNRVTELATPILLTANNEVSRLFVGEEVPLNRSFNSATNFNANQAVANSSTTIEFRPVGTTLMLTPSINADRTVTLRILQETSEIVENGANVLVPAGDGVFNEQAIDIVRSRTVSGTVVAKDGLSVAIGGLIQEAATDTRKGIPVVSKLPVVGFFFRQQGTARTRTELVVVIRPYVFNTPTESAVLSQELMSNLSLNPSTPEYQGTLGTFAPHEAVRPNPPTNPLETILRFHSIEPKVY